MAGEQPRSECDLVMKGGITSGVVYPSAVLKLHDEGYRFRGIGGASAGAIAAAATAAAQHGEASGGFDRFRAINGDLSAGGLLLQLFQPAEDARPLFDIALRIQAWITGRQKEGDDGLGAAIARDVAELHATARARYPRSYEAGQATGGRWGAILGGAAGLFVALIAIACSAVAARSLPVAAIAIAIAAGILLSTAGFVIGGCVGGMLGVARGIASGAEPNHNFFGLCAGHSEAPDKPALTDWLHAQINALAGKPLEDPLTFGDLRGPDPGKRAIDLAMLTTDLSYGQPYMLPLDMKEFLFNEAEMRRLFPREVVDYLVRAGERRGVEMRYPEGYYRMRTEGEMPVIVATRMSLSFPLLLSAVPLYRIKDSAAKQLKADPGFVCDAAEHLEKHWFSDGGISSNFPIHFFDRWLPGRPTFGIKLTKAEREDDAPWMPRAQDEIGARPSWGSVEGIFGFLRAIVATALGYRDNMQAALPSYRERIVRVPLMDDEGGLNLDMPPEIIDRLKKKGDDAGRIMSRFDFMQHKWVRFRVLTEHLERELRQLDEVFSSGPGYDAVIDEQARIYEAARSPEEKWYRPEPRRWCEGAKERMAALMNLVEAWKQADRAGAAPGDPPAVPAIHDEALPRFFEHRAARPTSVLRITPPL